MTAGSLCAGRAITKNGLTSGGQVESTPGHMAGCSVPIRLLLNLTDEQLSVATDRDLPRLDKKLSLETLAQPTCPKAVAQRCK